MQGYKTGSDWTQKDGYWEDANGNKYEKNPYVDGKDGNYSGKPTFRNDFNQDTNEKLGRDYSNLKGIWASSLDPLVIYLKQYAGNNRTLYEAILAGFAANDKSGMNDTAIDYAGWIMNPKGMDYGEWLKENIGKTSIQQINNYLGELGQSWGQVSQTISDGGNQVNGVIAEFAKNFKGISASALESLATSLGINLVDLINSTGQNYNQASREFIQAVNNSTSEWLLSWNDFKQAWEITTKQLKGMGEVMVTSGTGDNNLEDPIFHNQPADASALVGVGTKYSTDDVKARLEAMGYSVSVVSDKLLSISSISDAAIGNLIKSFEGISYVERNATQSINSLGNSAASSVNQIINLGDTAASTTQQIIDTFKSFGFEVEKVTGEFNSILVQSASKSMDEFMSIVRSMDSLLGDNVTDIRDATEEFSNYINTGAGDITTSFDNITTSVGLTSDAFAQLTEMIAHLNTQGSSAASALQQINSGGIGAAPNFTNPDDYSKYYYNAKNGISNETKDYGDLSRYSSSEQSIIKSIEDRVAALMPKSYDESYKNHVLELLNQRYMSTGKFDDETNATFRELVNYITSGGDVTSEDVQGKLKTFKTTGSELNTWGKTYATNEMDPNYWKNLLWKGYKRSMSPGAGENYHALEALYKYDWKSLGGKSLNIGSGGKDGVSIRVDGEEVTKSLDAYADAMKDGVVSIEEVFTLLNETASKFNVNVSNITSDFLKMLGFTSQKSDEDGIITIDDPIDAEPWAQGKRVFTDEEKKLEQDAWKKFFETHDKNDEAERNNTPVWRNTKTGEYEEFVSTLPKSRPVTGGKPSSPVSVSEVTKTLGNLSYIFDPKVLYGFFGKNNDKEQSANLIGSFMQQYMDENPSKSIDDLREALIEFIHNSAAINKMHGSRIKLLIW